MVNAAGPDLDWAETVTLFHDLCLLAPAALIGAAISWHSIDATHIRGTFTNGSRAVSAEMVFDHDHDFVEFVSDDGLRALTDDKPFTRQTGGPRRFVAAAMKMDGTTSLTGKNDGTPQPLKGSSPISSFTSTRSLTTSAARSRPGGAFPKGGIGTKSTYAPIASRIKGPPARTGT